MKNNVITTVATVVYQGDGYRKPSVTAVLQSAFMGPLRSCAHSVHGPTVGVTICDSGTQVLSQGQKDIGLFFSSPLPSRITLISAIPCYGLASLLLHSLTETTLTMKIAYPHACSTMFSAPETLELQR